MDKQCVQNAATYVDISLIPACSRSDDYIFVGYLNTVKSQYLKWEKYQGKTLISRYKLTSNSCVLHVIILYVNKSLERYRLNVALCIILRLGLSMIQVSLLT